MLALLTILISSAYALNCTQLSCRSAYDDFEVNQCMKANDGINGLELALQICNDQFYSFCPTTIGNNTCQLPPQQPKVNIAAAGEPCALDINCIDGTCENGICNSLYSQGWSCQRDTQCGVGFYCETTCKPQVPSGEICSRDEMCVNSCGCFLGVCKNYFTIGNYSIIPSCNDGQNFLCESGACIMYNGNFICLPQNKLNVSSPFCYYDSECTALLEPGINFNTKCLCAQNGYGYLMCSLAPGDDIYMNYTNILGKWVNSKVISKCHTTRRTNLNCVKAYWDYQDYVTLAYFQAYALNYTQFNNSDSCVKNIYQSSFWRLQAEYFSFTKNKESGGLILALGISLFYL
ncbi:hypothetical protein SteCoe_24323 [Stentor coeruleus]|uniref:Dickkopf N-terminal cysteine-rich domain-containing protein n=1 Tax=Stentor coeruleus TaxID=5963 RepID=A0A1R2BHS9_9CILI|nr:hypothetical protein SteCoe_24323 [Stentor coeruleus]